MNKEEKAEHSLVKAGNEINKFDNPADVLSFAESLVDRVIDSSFAENFMKTDTEGVDTINKADIINAIVLGHEMGIPPVASLALGRKLDINKYFSMIRGKAMGLDLTTSMTKLHTVEVDDKVSVSADVSLVNKCVLDAGVTTEVIRDARVVPMYVDAIDGIYVGHKYDIFDNNDIVYDEFHIIIGTSDTAIEAGKEAMRSGKIVLKRQGITKVTTIKFIRPSPKMTLTISYSIQQAINAGLMRGFKNNGVDDDGKQIWVKGRTQWKNHPETMLRNRALSIGGRIIAADKLQGIYSSEEALDMIPEHEVSKSDISVDAIES